MSWTLARRGSASVCVLAMLGVVSAGAPLARTQDHPAPGRTLASGPAADQRHSEPRPSPRTGEAWHAETDRSERTTGEPQSTSTPGATPGSEAVAYTDSGIPAVAVRAYRNAAELIARTDAACHLKWSLLAAIGRVESNHGRYGDTTLYRSGRTSPPILGLVLDGSGETARITDTDEGQLDGNATFDRAVGPMQFLPGTWQVAGVDGDGDGNADPSNMFDAAASAGRYLCAGDVDLSIPAERRDAVFGYNHSSSYVDLVLSLADEYAEGSYPDTGQGPKDPPDTEPLDPPDDGLPPASPDDPPADSPGGGGQGDTNSNGGDKNSNGGDKNDDNGDSGKDDKGEQNDDDEGDNGKDDDEDDSGKDDDEPAPSVAGLSPARGPAGIEVTLTGKRLDDANVSFGDAPATVRERSSSELVVTAPERTTAGPVAVTVEGRDGDVAKELEFTYEPEITRIEPPRASTEGGDTVVIHGSSLDGATAGFGDTPAETIASSGDRLEVRVPAADGGATVKVKVTSAKLSSATLEFTYHEPAVTLDPASVPAGERTEVSVTAEHTEFTDAVREVTVDDAKAEIVERTAGELTVRVPAHGVGDVPLTVHRRGRDDVSATLTYRPDVAETAPTPVEPRERLTLRGTGFTADSSVLLARKEEETSIREEIELLGKGKLALTVPDHVSAGTYQLRVSTDGVPSEAVALRVGTR